MKTKKCQVLFGKAFTAIFALILLNSLSSSFSLYRMMGFGEPNEEIKQEGTKETVVEYDMQEENSEFHENYHFDELSTIDEEIAYSEVKDETQEEMKDSVLKHDPQEEKVEENNIGNIDENPMIENEDETNLDSPQRSGSDSEADSLKSMLRDNPEKLNAVDDNGWSLIHEAVAAHRVEDIYFLIGKHVDLNQRTNSGEKPIDLSRKYHQDDQELYLYLDSHTYSVNYNAAGGHVYFLKEMYKENDGRLQKPDANSWTALHEAARAGQMGVLDFLKGVEGINIDGETLTGETALQIAKNSRPDDHSLHEFLQSWSNEVMKDAASAKMSAVHEAAAEGNLNFLQEVFEEDPRHIHTKDHNGWTPIHEAVRAGEEDVLNFLVSNGAHVNKEKILLGLADSIHGQDHVVYRILDEL